MCVNVWRVCARGVCVSFLLVSAFYFTLSIPEAAPASTEGRGQAHEGRQKGAWLTIHRYARNWIVANNACERALEAKSCSACCSLFGL